MDDLPSIAWHNGKVRILDQTRLPEELVMLEISDHHGVIRAIQGMSIRGAPAIGIAAAFGVVLSVWQASESDRPAFFEQANQAMAALRKTRPTAKNLSWALDRMRNVLANHINRPLREIKEALLKEAQSILKNDVECCRAIGRIGAQLLTNTCGVLTHCNAGALATGGYGTALGVIRAAVAQGKKVHVYVGETRPLLQGARLTAFELCEDHIPVTVVCDTMVAQLMKSGKIQFVIVGADRIARNGDTANKIGTYGLAVLAKYHRIPFYVAAPIATFDMDLRTGDQIPIEIRDEDEVRRCGNRVIVPEEAAVINPAFDITPSHLIDAFITEKGLIRSPFQENIAEMLK